MQHRPPAPLALALLLCSGCGELISGPATNPLDGGEVVDSTSPGDARGAADGPLAVPTAPHDAAWPPPPPPPEPDAAPPPPPEPDAAPPPPPEPDAAPAPVGDLEFCVAETNRYRAQVGHPPVSRSQAIEAYAAEGAESDHHAQSPHAHFIATSGGGVAYAENACPGWLGWYVQGDIQSTLSACLAAFFSEGPGGGHYENMIGPYTTVGCGWYVDAQGSITIIQDFGR